MISCTALLQYFSPIELNRLLLKKFILQEKLGLFRIYDFLYSPKFRQTKNKGIVLESVDAKIKVENMELRECLNEIKAIIKNFAKEDILTLPDLTKEQNYKFIAGQYAKPIKEIIKKITQSRFGK